ncbi:MAG: 1-acyl-sn-glycerol-3-phosphate acyltransferase [Clostridia bacterium]|nr:1-acyl-sn-glycerol-3-phosphate acyltransferase [Clostridia bacterium]
MKILGNVTPLIKLVYALKYLRPNKREIYAARERGDFEKEREAILGACTTWSAGCIKLFDADVRVQGREFLPKEGPVVYVANHQGYADIPVCLSILTNFQTGFIAKEELAKIPLYGQWIKDIRSVMIQRGDARSSLRAIEEGIEYIKQGFSLVVFPEGTRSRGKDIAEFKKGSLRLATKSGVPVVPITINGTYKIFEETGRIRSGQRVDIIIHEPIETKDMDRAEASQLSERVEKIIRDDYNKLKAQEV